MRSILCIFWICLTFAPALAESSILKHVQQGDLFAAQGQLDRAIEEYEKALAAGAGSAQFLNRLGEAYLRVENFNSAVTTFRKSLMERPGQLSVYSRLGEIYLASGRLDSAIHYVREALVLAPDAGAVHSSLGGLYLQAGEHLKAKAHLDTALQIDTRNPEAHRFLGFYFTQADSFETARKHFEKILEFLPNDFEAQNNIAFLYARQRQYREALEYYKRAKEQARDAFEAHTTNLQIEAVRAIMDGKVRARYILVKSQAAARDLLQRIESGEEFGALAQKFSLAPNAQFGGDTDFFGAGELMSEFEQAVMQLQVGEISDIVQVPMGFMIIQRMN